MVVDCGYSFTHIVPFFRGKALLEGVRRQVIHSNTLTSASFTPFMSCLCVCRINCGGKHLTNLLKEVISYRQLMVMDETYVINELKEELCFVSLDFDKDMRTAK